jgi:hypothetical protein
MESFQEAQQKFARELSSAMMQTLNSSSTRVERTLDFDSFLNFIRATSRNVTRDKNQGDDLPKARQQVYPNHDQDLWNIWSFLKTE